MLNALCHCNNCQKTSGSAFMANGTYKKTVSKKPYQNVYQYTMSMIDYSVCISKFTSVPVKST